MRLARTTLALAVGLASACAGAARPAAAPPVPSAAPAGADTATYRLVWSDEFDRDGRPDSTNWTYERGFVRNEEAQWYRPENARVEGGRLILEARRERVPNPQYDSTRADWRHARPYAGYTSASVTTRGLHAWRYGRFEMRARIPVSPGAWPAFWTVGDRGRWPGSGEIDIMEYYRRMLLANVAWLGPDGRAAWDDTRTPLEALGDSTWADRFHVWRMDWDERAIRLYVDDRLLNTTPLDSTFNADGSGFNPLRQAHHVILNLAIGGQNGGDPAGTRFPVRYEIDWVRVYQRAEDAAEPGQRGGAPVGRSAAAKPFSERFCSCSGADAPPGEVPSK